MVKQLLSKTLLLVAVLCTGATAAWADTYKKITSADDLEVGAQYLIVYEDDESPKALGEISNTSTKYGLGVSVTITNGEITITNQAVAVLTLGGSSDGWTFKSSLDNQYLYWSSGNSLETYASINNKSKWTFQINTSSKAQKLINVGTNTRFIKWNPSSPRFACYTSGQQDICLYKKVVVVRDPYSVTLGDDNSTITEAKAGDGVTLPSRDNVGDYNFVGWSTSNIQEETATAPNVIPSGTYRPTANITLYPVYSHNVGGTPIVLHSVNIGDYAEANNWTTASGDNGQHYSIAIDDNVSVGVTENGNNGKVYFNDPYWQWRVYTGATLTITSTEDMSSVTISNESNSDFGLKYGDQTLNKGVAFDVTGKTVEISVTATTRITDISVSTGGGATTYYTSNPVVITTETATVTSAGWATYVPTNAVQFRSGTKAYIVEAADEATALLTQVKSVPAGTPILLEGKGEYTMDIVENSTTDVSGNYLLVVGEHDYIMGNQGAYVLGSKNGNTGFYLWTGDRLAVGKVYMYVDASSSPQMLQLVKPGQEETGIEAVESASAEREGIYNLQGVRVAEPSKGLYIVGGKKVMFNK